MKSVDSGNGAVYRVYTQTTLEMAHMEARRNGGDARLLFLNARGAILHSSEFAMPSHRGDICQAQTQYCRVSGSCAVNIRMT